MPRDLGRFPLAVTQLLLRLPRDQIWAILDAIQRLCDDLHLFELQEERVASSSSSSPASLFSWMWMTMRSSSSTYESSMRTRNAPPPTDAAPNSQECQPNRRRDPRSRWRSPSASCRETTARPREAPPSCTRRHNRQTGHRGEGRFWRPRATGQEPGIAWNHTRVEECGFCVPCVQAFHGSRKS